MRQILAFFGSIAFYVVLASITGGARNVAFSAPGVLMVAIASTVCIGG